MRAGDGRQERPGDRRTSPTQLLPPHLPQLLQEPETAAQTLAQLPQGTWGSAYILPGLRLLTLCPSSQPWGDSRGVAAPSQGCKVNHGPEEVPGAGAVKVEANSGGAWEGLLPSPLLGHDPAGQGLCPGHTSLQSC